MPAAGVALVVLVADVARVRLVVLRVRVVRLRVGLRRLVLRLAALPAVVLRVKAAGLVLVARAGPVDVVVSVVAADVAAAAWTSAR